MAIEREVDDARSIWDAGASVKRKESQLGKEAKDFYSARVLKTGPRLPGPRLGSVIPRWEALQGS